MAGGAVLLVAATVLVTLFVTGRKDGSPVAAQPSAAGSTSGSAADLKQREVIVRFQLNDSSASGSSCRGSGGYSDIGSGTPVTIKDQSGTILAAGELGTATSAFPCTWTVFLEQVPMDRSFYSVEVGRRGQITKSREELQSTGYEFDLSLGN